MADDKKTEKAEEKAAEKAALKDTEVADMVRHWHRIGRPERAHQLKELYRAGEDIPYQLLDKAGVKAEKDLVGKVDVPPRTGRGSGVDSWREFAAEVSDFDQSVLDEMSRDEIIQILEDREIIPALDEENDEEESE